ncbi:MAG: hypothetical protein SAJ37_23995, partial [Oscillatoria sp. PMC 1068.18]|nr:hypothetical protein [Oscillatoria sp. PMC 1068.18]
MYIYLSILNDIEAIENLKNVSLGRAINRRNYFQVLDILTALKGTVIPKPCANAPRFANTIWVSVS